MPVVGVLIPLQGPFNEPIANQGDWQTDDAGANERWPENLQSLPLRQLREMQLMDSEFGRKSVRTIENPESNLVFPTKDHRPDGQQDVVESHRDNRRNLAPSKDPRGEDRKQCFKAREWGEAPENANRNPTGNGMRSILRLMHATPTFFEAFLEIEIQRHEKLSATFTHTDSSSDHFRPRLFPPPPF